MTKQTFTNKEKSTLIYYCSMITLLALCIGSITTNRLDKQYDRLVTEKELDSIIDKKHEQLYLKLEDIITTKNK